jgi:hypothetical protein
MDRAEKKRRVKEWEQQQRAVARATFPLADPQLQALFDHVEQQVAAEGCDHSRRFTESWLSTSGIAAEPVLSWLADHGGYCDCEVVANAQEDWQSSWER